jgi:hypothetical protein
VKHGLEGHIHTSGYPARHFLNFRNDEHDGILL